MPSTAVLRLRWYPRAIAAAAAVGFAIVAARGSGVGDGRGGVVGGDFAAFFSAGRIVLAGDARDLYTIDRQKREQAAIPGPPASGFLPFVYPPFVAAAFAPLAALPYRASYGLYTLLMAAAIALGASRLRAVIPEFARLGGWGTLAIAAFYPMFVPLVGGQNTPIGFMCAACALAALAGGHDLRAGLWLGVWLFKPHFAIPVIGLTLIGRRFRALAGVAILAVAYYAVALLIGGWAWPAWWWRNVAIDFVLAEQTRNAGNLASLTAFADACFGVGSRTALVVAGALALATIGWLAWTWWRRSRARPVECMAVAVAGALLISPHTMWYDVGLAALPLAVVAGLGGRGERVAVAAVWLLALLSGLPALGLPIHPFVFVAVATFTLAARRLVAPGGAGGGAYPAAASCADVMTVSRSRPG